MNTDVIELLFLVLSLFLLALRAASELSLIVIAVVAYQAWQQYRTRIAHAPKQSLWLRAKHFYRRVAYACQAFKDMK